MIITRHFLLAMTRPKHIEKCLIRDFFISFLVIIFTVPKLKANRSFKTRFKSQKKAIRQAVEASMKFRIYYLYSGKYA